MLEVEVPRVLAEQPVGPSARRRRGHDQHRRGPAGAARRAERSRPRTAESTRWTTERPIAAESTAWTAEAAGAVHQMPGRRTAKRATGRTAGRTILAESTGGTECPAKRSERRTCESTTRPGGRSGCRGAPLARLSHCPGTRRAKRSKARPKTRVRGTRHTKRRRTLRTEIIGLLGDTRRRRTAH